MKIYTYAIINSHEKINTSVGGLEGAPVYNLPYRDIGAVVSRIINQINEMNRDCILKHEEIVERLMENFTVLPVRFLTVFNQEEEALVMLKEYYQDFKENFERLHNRVEFGIRVIWSGETIKNRIIEASKRCHADINIPDSSLGKSFAKERFKKYKIDKEFAEEADRCIALLDDFFNRFAVEKKLEKLKSDNLLLSAFYLVEKERQKDFREAFERTRSTPGDLKFLCSGPWPPYNFINLKKKPYCFKNFGSLRLLEKETTDQNLTHSTAPRPTHTKAAGNKGAAQGQS